MESIHKKTGNSQNNRQGALQPVRANALVNSECEDAQASFLLASLFAQVSVNFSSAIRRNQLSTTGGSENRCSNRLSVTQDYLEPKKALLQSLSMIKTNIAFKNTIRFILLNTTKGKY